MYLFWAIFSGSAYFLLMVRTWKKTIALGWNLCADHNVEKVLVLVCDAFLVSVLQWFPVFLLQDKES